MNILQKESEQPVLNKKIAISLMKNESTNYQ